MLRVWFVVAQMSAYMTEYSQFFHVQVPELDTRQSVAVGLLEAEWQIAEFLKVGASIADVYWVSFACAALKIKLSD